MELLEAIVLGLVQGVTEFLPISSSGHLTLVQNLFGISGEGFHYFLEWINLGTLIAMLIYFAPQISNIIKNIFVKRDWRLARNIIITCIPAGLAGLLLSDLIENSSLFGSIGVLAVMLGLVGVVMILINKIPHLSTVKDLSKLPPTRALVIGVAQILALIPGTSRLATTMITGRIMGMNNKLAAEYSFLVAIPLMAAVYLKSFLSSASRDYLFANLAPLALANVMALFAGLAAVRVVMRYFAKKRPARKKSQALISDSLQPFGYYRVGIAILVLILALTV